jgi:hypothetical protein
MRYIRSIIRYKIVIRFGYFCFFIFIPKHRGFNRQKMVSNCFYNTRTEVLTAVLMDIGVFWDVTCRLASICRWFGSSIILRNVGNFSQDDTESHLKRFKYSWFVCFHIFVLISEVWKNTIIYRVFATNNLSYLNIRDEAEKWRRLRNKKIPDLCL